MRLSRALGVLCVAGASFAAQSAFAQAPKPADYPNRPISFLVAYPAGGGMDITARTLAAQMERVTGLQFRVENRGGGGGIIGNTFLAKQTQPDGYTVGILANPTMFVNILKQGAQFKKADVEPIAGITFEPVVWAVRTNSEIGKKDFAGVLAQAKANPETIKVAVIPNASFDMATRIVQRQSGAKFNIVPFPGGKPEVVALLGGNVDMAAIYYSEISQYVADGSLKVLAVADNEKFAHAPDAATMKELGIKMASGTWGAERFAAVPKGTDPATKAFLASIIAKTLADKQAQEAFAKVDVTVMAKDMAEQEKLYDASYEAVREYLEENGELKAEK